MKNKILLFFSLMLLFVSRLSAQDSFVQIMTLDELTSGEYLIVGDGSSADGIMLNATISAPAINYTSVSNPGNVINSGFTSDNVFTINVSGTNLTIYHPTVGYVSWGRGAATGNHANFYNDTPESNETWNASVTSGLWTLENGFNSARILQWNNGAPRFAAYAGAQVKLKLFKKLVSEPTVYTITVTQAEGGTISPEGEVEVEEGESVSFTATPSNDCIVFANWVVDGNYAGTDNPFVLENVTADHTITAVFVELQATPIEATAGPNGTISPEGITIVNCGDDLTYYITPNAGYVIADVVVDGVSQGDLGEYTFSNVKEPHNISATFASMPIGGSCFLETFNELTNIVSGTSYGEGSYTNNGITWTFNGQSPLGTGSDGADYSIDGQGILLRRASDSYLQATVPAGVGVFSFNYRKAYTGGNPRQLELIVNGTSVAMTPEFGAGAGDDPTVYSFSYVLDTTADTVVRIKLSGDSGTNRHATIDNIAWTCNEVIEPCLRTITSSAGIGGAISPSGEIIVDCGVERTFTITADAGYEIADVLVDGASVGAVSTYTFENISENHTIEAIFTEIPVGGPCFLETFNELTNIVSGTSYGEGSYTNNGITWTFNGQSPLGTGSDGADYSIDGQGILLRRASDSYLQATVPAGVGTFSFEYRKAYTGASSRQLELIVNGTSVAMTSEFGAGTGADDTVYTFSYDLNTTAETVVRIKLTGSATTNRHTTVDNISWTCDVVEPCENTITATAGEGGSITPSGDVVVECGAEQTFAITADEGFEIADVLVDGESVGAVSTYTFENITEAHTIEASFVEIPCENTITATAGAGGTITPSGDVVVKCGAEQSFTITADAGFEIEDVLVDGASVGAVSTYTFENVTEAHTIEATFIESTIEGPCFVETFNELTEIATGTTYAEGTYTNNGITWNFHGQSPLGTGTDGADYSIDGQGILLRRASDSYLQTTVPAGVGTFSFEYRKAYTGGNPRQLELVVNGTSVALTPEFGEGSGEDATVYTFSYDLNTTAETVVRIKLSGDTTNNRHTTVDNISWTCGDVEPCNNTITATAGAGGTITPSGDVVVECGAEQTFTITADAGFEIEDVLVDGASVGAVSTYTFENVTEAHTIEATFIESTIEGPCFVETFNELTEIATGTTYAEGTYTNNGITWSFHGQSPLEAGTDGADYSIDGQGILLRRASDSYLQTTVPAGVGTFSFEYRKAYTGGNPRQLELVVNGTSVALTPEFGEGSGEDATVYTFSYDLNTTAETVVRIKLSGDTTNNRHTTIDNISWTCGDVEPCNNTITATAGAGGTITPSGNVVVECGAEQTFLIAANAGFEIADVLVDGTSVGAVASYTFENVNEDHTIEAVFEPTETEGPCFVEDFNGLTEIATGTTYAEGTYTNNGITWNFHGQSPLGAGAEGADYSIDGQGILLRRASDSYLQTTVPAGVGTFTFEYRKAYTGGNPRQLEVLVDGVQVGVTPEFGEGSGEDPTVYSYTVTLNTTEEVVLRIKLTGETTTNRHATIDNISWTCGEGCFTPAPIAEATQNFIPGQTLADLVVEGENLTWYDADGNILPETTELVNGTTYYVSQTIDGCESDVTAITVYDTTLGVGGAENSQLSFYPNPVKDVLNVTNSANIDQIEVFALNGALVYSQKANSKVVFINLATIESGSYIVRVKSGKDVKTFKILKK